MMKEPEQKKSFYLDRNFLTGFVLSLVAVIALYVFFLRPNQGEEVSPVTSGGTAQPAPASGTSMADINWQKGISFQAPGTLPADLLRVGEEIWVFTEDGKTLRRVNLSGEALGEVVLEFTCSKAAWDGEWLWCTQMSSTVAQLDPATGKVKASFDSEFETVQAIDWDGQSLWLMTQKGALEQYDRSGKKLAEAGVSKNGFARDLAWAGNELWVAHIPPQLVRYNAQIKRLASTSTFCGVQEGVLEYSIAWDGESMWFLDFISGQITQCTPGG